MMRSMTRHSSIDQARRGFTLLEMILALAIGLILMAALYVMMSSQLSQSQAGRASIQEANTARAILTRIASDIVGSLGAYDPRQLPDVAVDVPVEAEATDMNTNTETTPAETTSTFGSVFNLGVVGETDRLIVTTGRVPRELLLKGELVSDLRRVAFWVVPGKGLVREEITAVTGDLADQEPDAANAMLVAPEVTAISFQYWDPQSQWLTTWDGSQPADLPVGPPAAIEITITMGANRTLEDGTTTRANTYTHVVTLPTGNNFSLQEATMP